MFDLQRRAQLAAAHRGADMIALLTLLLVYGLGAVLVDACTQEIIE